MNAEISCIPIGIQVVLVVKKPPANAGDIRDVGLIPGSGRCPGGGHGNPHQCSCLENPRDGGAWWAAVYGVAQAPLSMGFSRQVYWSGLSRAPSGDLPNPEIKPTSLISPAMAGRFFTTSATWEAP